MSGKKGRDGREEEKRGKTLKSSLWIKDLREPKSKTPCGIVNISLFGRIEKEAWRAAKKKEEGKKRKPSKHSNSQRQSR